MIYLAHRNRKRTKALYSFIGFSERGVWKSRMSSSLIGCTNKNAEIETIICSNSAFFYCFFVCLKNNKIAPIIITIEYPRTGYICDNDSEKFPLIMARSSSTA